MRRCSRWTAWMMIFFLVLSMFGNVGILMGAEKDVMSISTANELLKLAENCTLDTWSKGKTIKLAADIDVSDSDFESIPIFSGTFEGNGYTITGLNINGNGSNQGLFRYIQKGAVVKNVIVKGNVVAGGTKKNIGGIAGKNAGTIKDSMFIGTVKGESYVGGMVGINEASGQIISCITQGIALGEHYVGGLAGENLGTILSSKNKMNVNTSASESSVSLEKLEEIEVGQINSTENTSSKTDIGGITGFSTGIVQSCKNYGTVGYQHIGYNVGGIVGRQSGYINDCINYAEVYGRKDVGGIAGQVEPYISLEFSSDKASELQNELNKLQALMNKAIGDASGYSSDLSVQLNDTKGYVDSALNTTGDLISQTEGIYNESIDQINDLSARVTSTLQKLVPIIDQTGSIGEEMTSALQQFEEALSSLEVTSEEGRKVLATLYEALDSVQINAAEYTKAMEKISAALKQLREAVGDEGETRAALESLRAGFSDLGDSLEKMGSGFIDISKQMYELKQWIKTDENWNSLVTGLGEAGTALKEMKTAACKVEAALKALQEVADTEAVEAALISLQEATKSFLSAANHLANALKAIGSEDVNNSDMEKITAELSQASSDLQMAMESVNLALEQLKGAHSNEESEAAKKDLQEALQRLSEAVKKAKSANEKISTAIKNIKESASAEKMSQSIERLNKSIEKINEGMDDMFQALADIQSVLEDLDGQIDWDKVKASADKLESAMGELTSAMEGTDTVIADLKKVVSAGQDAVDAADVTLAKMKVVIKSMQGISERLVNVTGDIYELISDLASQPTISFPNLDSDYINHTNNLTNTLGDLSNALGSINQTVSSYNELLISDLQNISNQFFTVTNLLIDVTLNSEEISTDISEYKEDISDADTESNTQGKILGSTNQGEIQGDINVGGVAGSMAIEYDFDPEDDVKKVGTSSLKFQYLARAVIRECSNKGKVTSKKNYVGSIVGRMDLGTVMESTGYGRIESKDGDYVGGIAGASYSHIKNSFSMCILSGNKSVGGIAGYGTKLTNNYAMVDIENAVESKGAIAGGIENLNSLIKNYFVNRGVAGIDQVSYSGKAEPVSYEDFSKVQGLPAEFTSLKLTFIADGETIAELPFEFGGSIDQSLLPEIPQKEGCYGRWPEFDYENLTFSAELEAIYTPYTSVIASSTAREGKLLALVEGTFDADAVLNVVQAEVVPPAEAGSEAEIWSVTILGTSDNDENQYPIRLLKPESGKTNIYSLQADGSWKKLSYKNNGSYAIVNMEGSSHTFCIDSKDNTRQMIVMAVTVVTGIAILFGFILLQKRKNKTQ